MILLLSSAFELKACVDFNRTIELRSHYSDCVFNGSIKIDVIGDGKKRRMLIESGFTPNSDEKMLIDLYLAAITRNSQTWRFDIAHNVV